MFGFGRKTAEEQIIDTIVQDMIETTRAIPTRIRGKILALYALHADRERPISLPSPEYDPTSLPKETLLNKAMQKRILLQEMESVFSAKLQQRDIAEASGDENLEIRGHSLSKRALELLFVDTNLIKLQICTYAYGIEPKRSADITLHIWDQMGIAKYNAQSSIEELIDQYAEFPDPVRDSSLLPTVDRWVAMTKDLRVRF